MPTEGTISALNILHLSIVFDLHQVTEIEAELLGGDGIAVERIKHANLVSFTCLKAFAFDLRFERKDAHDLIYCLEHAPKGAEAVAQIFRQESEGQHGDVVKNALAILRRRFAQVGETVGYRKEGSVAVPVIASRHRPPFGLGLALNSDCRLDLPSPSWSFFEKSSRTMI